MPAITCLCLAFILGPQEPYKMYLKPFITINKLKKAELEIFLGAHTCMVTAYAFPSIKNDFIVDENSVCLAVKREHFFS